MLWSLGSYLNFWFLGSVTGQWTVFIKKVGHWEEGHYANCWTAVIFKGFFGGASQQRKCQSWGNKSLKSVEIDCCAVCDQTITKWSKNSVFRQLFRLILSVIFPLLNINFSLFSTFFVKFFVNLSFLNKKPSLCTRCKVRSVLPTRNSIWDGSTPLTVKNSSNLTRFFSPMHFFTWRALPSKNAKKSFDHEELRFKKN